MLGFGAMGETQPKKIGQYEIEGRLGRGGMGTVFRAMDGPLGRRVALKVLSAELAQDSEFRMRFLKEGASAASDTTHPRIVSIHNLVEEGEVIAIAMELVDGPSLETLVKEQGPLEERVALDYLLQTIDALSSKAERGIIHRDVKPGNVLVDLKRGIKLADFGLSRCLSETSRLTQPDTVMGSPSYMSPEQAQGADADHRSDIYSLGATLHFMLVGKSPFTAPNTAAMALAHMNTPPPDVTHARPELTLATAKLVQRMLAKDPAKRPQTYAELEREAQVCLEVARTQKPSGAVKKPASKATPPPASEPENAALEVTAKAGHAQAPVEEKPQAGSGRTAVPAGKLAPVERLKRRGKVKAGIAAALAVFYMVAFTGEPGMVWVPAGVYVREHKDNPRKIHIDRGFYIDRYEVTNADYALFDPTHKIPRGHELHPVTDMKEDAARKYLTWAGKRLPTDAEWEAAARGPGGYTYPWGNEKITGAANLKDAAENATRPIGSYSKDVSGFGCYDMGGNVREFTYDGTKANLIGGSFKDEMDDDLLVPPNSYWVYLDHVGFRGVKDLGFVAMIWGWIKLFLLLALIGAVCWLL
jgi:serine/threonine protein kinase